MTSACSVVVQPRLASQAGGLLGAARVWGSPAFSTCNEALLETSGEIPQVCVTVTKFASAASGLQILFEGAMYSLLCCKRALIKESFVEVVDRLGLPSCNFVSSSDYLVPVVC